MCGIAGILNLHEDAGVPRDLLEGMVAVQRHRGPDGMGFYRDKRIGLGHARLSIIDLEDGGQPMHNEDRSLWITFNGEIFNYRELRADLEARGHTFLSSSDTEVILHCFEEHGPGCLHQLNGQFSFAVWDSRQQELFAARDRVGIRPFFYTRTAGRLLFASEIKALFMDRTVERRIDPRGLDQVSTFWMTVPPRTAFCGIEELPAGHFLTVQEGEVRIERYWDPVLEPEPLRRSEQEYAEELRALLIDATRLQLRADVPVGSYLSGGIDSAIITALIHGCTDSPLRTFSVTFADAGFDESPYQRRMVEHLGADHSSIACTSTDIGAVFPEVIWHTEKPVVRTAPAPLFLLSRLVRESGYKVVLTGEGADEILAGYDLFKEVKVRRFLERGRGSKWRPLILKRLYPWLASSPVRSLPYAEAFFSTGGNGWPPGCSSHVPRWKTTSMIKSFLSEQYRSRPGVASALDELVFFLGAGSTNSDELLQAQYVEMKTLLPGYLLSSQGDRVALAHSVESRFPFLDHRVIEFCNRLPAGMKMRALREKYLLKKSMASFLPPEITARTKQPYRAPDAMSFLSGTGPEYIGELLSARNLLDTGYFDPRNTELLIRKCRAGNALGFKDNMAVVFIVSTLLLHDLFIRDFDSKACHLTEGRIKNADHAAQA